MASLTESALSYPDNNRDNNENKDKKPWYNNVYLCIEKKGNSQNFDCFNCYTFANFSQDDIFYKKRFDN